MFPRKSGNSDEPETLSDVQVVARLAGGGRTPGRAPFVVIEGVDRVGKNTQADLLTDRLRSTGLMVSRQTTPDYETDTGKLISGFLKRYLKVVSERLWPDHQADTHVLQALMIVNRYEVADKISTCLHNGMAVVCVRWWPSALIYGVEDGLSEPAIQEACACLPVPDLCILLDAALGSVDTRLDRSSWYESDVAVQRRLALAYRRLWAVQSSAPPGKTRWLDVSAHGSTAEVSERVWHVVESYRKAT